MTEKKEAPVQTQTDTQKLSVRTGVRAGYKDPETAKAP
jgi:hypothetical protein